MQKILINYAEHRFFKSQAKNAISGKKHGFDEVYTYRFDDLDPHFVKRNAHILSEPKGAGYWIWKAQLILQTFEHTYENDYIFYSDSGAEFISSINPLLPLCDAAGGVLLFHLTPSDDNQEILQTKRDALILMDCDREDIIHRWPIHAGFQLYKNCDFAKYFVSKYLHYCEDERIVTDLPNTLGKNYQEFRNHRHDQSVLSCLQKKMNIPSYIDITQFGNAFRRPTDGYKQIINHTRNQE